MKKIWKGKIKMLNEKSRKKIKEMESKRKYVESRKEF